MPCKGPNYSLQSIFGKKSRTCSPCTDPIVTTLQSAGNRNYSLQFIFEKWSGTSTHTRILVPALQAAKITVYSLFLKSDLGPTLHTRVLVCAQQGTEITVYSLFLKSDLGPAR